MMMMLSCILEGCRVEVVTAWQWDNCVITWWTFSDFTKTICIILQSSYACLCFQEVLWPEFSLWNFFSAILSYQKNYDAIQVWHDTFCCSQLPSQPQVVSGKWKDTLKTLTAQYVCVHWPEFKLYKHITTTALPSPGCQRPPSGGEKEATARGRQAVCPEPSRAYRREQFHTLAINFSQWLAAEDQSLCCWQRKKDWTVPRTREDQA